MTSVFVGNWWGSLCSAGVLQMNSPLIIFVAHHLTSSLRQFLSTLWLTFTESETGMGLKLPMTNEAETYIAALRIHRRFGTRTFHQPISDWMPCLMALGMSEMFRFLAVSFSCRNGGLTPCQFKLDQFEIAIEQTYVTYFTCVKCHFFWAQTGHTTQASYSLALSTFSPSMIPKPHVQTKKSV